MSAAEAPHTFTLFEPERFLRLLRDSPTKVDLTGVTLAEMWSLAAMAARARRAGSAPIEVTGQSVARSFASVVGFDEVVEGRAGPLRGEEGRTVRLTEVWREDDIGPVATEIARLLAGARPEAESAAKALRYFVVELLRNVVQHSEDPEGGVVGAQLNDRGLHAAFPVYQAVVVDNGQGIRRHLQRTYPELETDDVALERSLWPWVSGAFPRGRTGGLENAGLGLFFISELVKGLDGRLLIASGTASLLVDPRGAQRQRFLDVGYPGTLVTFEIPAEPSRGFDELFASIDRLARERTPGRLVSGWLRFEPAPEGVVRFLVSQFAENNDRARQLAAGQIIPRIVRKEPVALDFVNVPVLTQSFAHAFLYEALRFAWAGQCPIYAVNAVPVVRSALEHVQAYAHFG